MIVYFACTFSVLSVYNGEGFFFYNKGKGCDEMYYPTYGTYAAPGGVTPRADMQPQPMTQPQQAVRNFFCRPVASREEALGVPVDFMGSPMFFPDLAHGVIYLKKFNPNTGSADMLEFRASAPQEQRPSEQQAAFAPLNDLLQLKDDLDNVKAEIERLKKPAGKVVKKNESDEQ